MPLDPSRLDPDPLRQFGAWLAEAQAIDLPLPNGFALATADGAGAPSVRMVLLRGFDAAGLRFFTNRESRKGRDLAANPHAAAVFHWPQLSRQVRFAGPVAALDEQASTAYWTTRPRGSQLAASASAQGEEIADRAALEERVAAVEAHLNAGDVPMPPFWGGYVLRPDVAEFWESREDRLHDRVEYRRLSHGWERRRLQP